MIVANFLRAAAHCTCRFANRYRLTRTCATTLTWTMDQQACASRMAQQDTVWGRHPKTLLNQVSYKEKTATRPVCEGFIRVCSLIMSGMYITVSKVLSV